MVYINKIVEFWTLSNVLLLFKTRNRELFKKKKQDEW
jgi:hypothetical protein